MGQLKIRASDSSVRERRETACKNVLKHLGVKLSDVSLLCFIDDERVGDDDFEVQKNLRLGAANRGFHVPNVKASLVSGSPPLPACVKGCLLGDAGDVLFQSLIYVHGRACEPEVSLVITFSHELQHFLQRRNFPQACDADTRLRGLLHSWQEHPSEHEAMLVSKRVASALLGDEAVESYIDSKIELSSTSQGDCREDQARWEFLRSLRTDCKYDFEAEVVELVKRHYPH